jgi:hypothetical protein
MYTHWDIVVREIGGGVWFFTNLTLALVLFAWGFQQCCLKKSGEPLSLILIAFSISEVLLGSAIRGFLTWQQFRVAGNGEDPSFWVATWPFLGLSVILNITGAAACVWLILPPAWRTLVTFYAMALAVLIPVGVFFLV